MLKRCEGSAVYIDDIIILGATETERNKRLQAVKKSLKENNLQLNTAKCIENTKVVTVLGQRISADGIQQDPDGVRAIQAFHAPTSSAKLRSFLGLTNYLSRFIPSGATVAQPLRELLQKNKAWTWGPAQEASFQKLKDMVACAPVLVPYDVTKPTKVSADSSSYELGAEISQSHGDE